MNLYFLQRKKITNHFLAKKKPSQKSNFLHSKFQFLKKTVEKTLFEVHIQNETQSYN